MRSSRLQGNQGKACIQRASHIACLLASTVKQVRENEGEREIV